MAIFRSGKTGSISVESQLLSLEQWTSRYTGQNLETTNFESGGFYTGVTGIEKLEWSVRGSWDASDNPLEDPPGLYPRDDGTNMLLTTATGDNQTWTLPSFMVSESDVDTTVQGVVKFNSSGTSQGSFTPPSGSI